LATNVDVPSRPERREDETPLGIAGLISAAVRCCEDSAVFAGWKQAQTEYHCAMEREGRGLRLAEYARVGNLFPVRSSHANPHKRQRLSYAHLRRASGSTDSSHWEYAPNCSMASKEGMYARRASDNSEKNEQETRRTSHCHSCRHQMQVVISSHSLPNSGIMQNACAHNTHPSNVFLARPRDNNPLGTSLHSTGDHFELRQCMALLSYPKGR
jgi:hypothetical protein